MAQHGPLAWILVLGLSLPPSAGAVSLVIDHLDTPDIVQAGATVSFAFALQFERDEVLQSTQAEISAPHLTQFTFPTRSGITGPNPWDLSSTFRRFGLDESGNPMWVHAENMLDEDDPPGVTWDEVGGLAPLGSFTAVASYNGEIVFDLSSVVIEMFDSLGTATTRYKTHNLPIGPEYQNIRTGVTIIGGLDLPLPPVVPPPVAPPPVMTPPTPPSEEPSSSSPRPTDSGVPRIVVVTTTDRVAIPEPPMTALAWLALWLVTMRRAWR